LTDKPFSGWLHVWQNAGKWESGTGCAGCYEGCSCHEWRNGDDFRRVYVRECEPPMCDRCLRVKEPLTPYSGYGLLPIHVCHECLMELTVPPEPPKPVRVWQHLVNASTTHIQPYWSACVTDADKEAGVFCSVPRAEHRWFVSEEP
jgi:hypothetical protein